jgi:alanyl-tRNA synthetase
LLEQLAYLHDPLTVEFEARIVRKTPAAEGQIDVILEETYFYPTGGGQAHDTGRLGEARVVDVFKGEDGRVVHRLDRDIAETTAAATIDWERRLGHMQHHSAQHILSRTLEETLGLDTLSARISAETPSTVDVPAAELSVAEVERVERFTNRIVFECRPIKSYVINDDQIETVPFRRPPKVSGQIRVVEVEAFDYSACGGTHCPNTGMVGLIKILRLENRNQRLRIHFAAGERALDYFQQYQEVVTELGRHFSTRPEEIVALAQAQAEQLRAAQRELRGIKAEILTLEAQTLAAKAEPYGGYRLVLATFKDRPLDQLRELAKMLREQAGFIVMLAGYDGHKLSLLVGCADDVEVSARALLNEHLSPIGGGGGGDARLAQGGGKATEAQVEGLFDKTREIIAANESGEG